LHYAKEAFALFYLHVLRIERWKRFLGPQRRVGDDHVNLNRLLGLRASGQPTYCQDAKRAEQCNRYLLLSHDALSIN
jgi:hypothetical protein